jgi:endonuclease/exonuclease/phosphatase (EEP) superfamily protein YafD
MYVLLLILSFAMVLLVFGSLIKDSYWLFKALEFPRLQKLFIIAVLLAGWGAYWYFNGEVNYWAAGGLLLSAAYLIYKILPYTPLNKKEVKAAPPHAGADEIKVLTANVFQDNRNYGKMLQQIRTYDPDVILLLETDQGWADAVQELDADYPHALKHPIDNTYGLLFYSRFPIRNGKVRFCVNDDIPCVDAELELPSGRTVKVWGLHPEPPAPQESITTKDQDKELMKVAFEARDCKKPALVFGDLNDVAWSHTTILFKKVSRLLDPRRGRGFYNSFSANHWFLRFPLDYLFCSSHFGLVSMKRLGHNGSDHFPMFIHLALAPEVNNERQLHADGEDLAEAKEMAEQPTT